MSTTERTTPIPEPVGPAAARRRRVRPLVDPVLRHAIGLLAVVVAVGLVAAPASTLPAPPVQAAQSCDTGVVLASSPSRVTQIEAAAQQDFFGRLNALRGSKGLATLAWNQAITGPAIDWSETMSTQVPPGGSSSDPGWLHHARDTGPGDGVSASQDYVTVNSRLVANWRALAENVGVGGMRSSCSTSDLEVNTDRVVGALHDAFVASPGHYKNMVGDYNQVGIGVHIDDDDLWVTVRFARGDLPTVAGSSTSNDVATYIDAVHEVFLGRSATSAERTFWANAVGSGDRLALTRFLASSDSWAGVRVDDLYRTVLGRGADAGGRAYWVDQIRRGLQLEIVAVEFYGSPEYFSRNGATNRTFVSALYRDLLGRSADGTGLSYWSGRLGRRELTRSTTAIGFYGSLESRSDGAATLYREVFGRTPSSSAVSAWANRMGAVGVVAVAAEMAASDGFYNQSVG